MLRCLILAFTGDHAAEVFEEEPAAVHAAAEQSPAAIAMQAIDRAGSGWHAALLSTAADRIIWGAEF